MGLIGIISPIGRIGFIGIGGIKMQTLKACCNDLEILGL